MPDIIFTTSRGTTSNPTIQFSGSASSSIRLEVLPAGNVAFMGNSGSLFGIVDVLTGSLSSVNDISGLPIFEVFSDDRVVMGRFNSNAFVVTGSSTGIGKVPNTNFVLDITGSVAITGSIGITGTLTGTASYSNVSQTASYVIASYVSSSIVSGSNVWGGVVSDSYGSVRAIPQNIKTTAYTLTSADVGRHVYTTASVTVPPSVFSIGDVSMIINSGSGSVSVITGSGVSLYLAGTTSVGNRTISTYGMASITCVASNLFYITGTGVA